MLCADHDKEVVISFCEDCDTLVCYECMTDTHQSHTFQKPNKVAKGKREKLNEMISERDGIISDLRKRYEELEISKEKSSNLEESIIQDINDRAEEIKADVDQIRDKQASEVHELFKAQNASVEGKGTRINEAIETLTKISEETEPLQNKSDIEIIQLSAWLSKQVEVGRNDSKVSQIQGEFVSGGESKENVEKIFGTFVNENETASDDMDSPTSEDTKIRKLLPVEIDIKGTMKSIHITGIDSGWLLDSNNILYFASSFSLKQYKKKAEGVLTYTVSERGEVYYVSVHSSLIRKIKTDGAVVRWCDMKPYSPVHIYIRKPDEISILFQTKNDKCVLHRFDDIGRKLESQSFEEKVVKISENEFGDFCTCYWKDGDRRLQTTVKGYRSNSIFQGMLGPNPSQNYSICDFCYVGKGRIIVPDTVNNVIYLLDRNCSFIKLLSSADEIKSPKYVSIDAFERLWISTQSGIYILSNWDQ